MSLLAELKRRSVFKVGAAYLVVAWLVIQVATSVLPQFDTPAWFLRAFILVVMLGFPIALVLAWVFDLTPEGVKLDAAPVGNKRMFAIAALLAIGTVVWWWKDQSVPAGAVVGADAHSIAVLPFVNMSGDAQNEYFSDGISEEILNVLARVPALSVAARTSSFQFKGEKRDVEQIARELKVRMVLEGSVRKQADRVRITAQLIDAKTGYHLWSQTYDRDLKDIFAIQDEIAGAIGDELKVRVLQGGAKGESVSGTSDLEAHDLYLRGLSLWQARTERSLWDARDAFERAAAADPTYAQAWAGSALVYAILADYSARLGYDEAYERGREAAEHALILDARMPEAYAALGAIEGNSGHLDISVALLRRAITLNPSYATAHQWLGNQLLQTGDMEAGLKELRRAAELDPRSIIVANNLAAALIEDGRYDEAVGACGPALEFAPDSFLCPEEVAMAHVLVGRLTEARPYFERWARLAGAGKGAQVAALFDALERRSDRATFARALAATPHRSWYDSSSGYLLTNWEIAILLMVLDQRELALGYIERNAALREYGSFSSALPTPVFDPIRCDPRFVAAVKAQRMVDARQAKVCGASAKTPSKAGA